MEEPAPLLTKAAASNEGRRGRRGWGEGQTPGSPHPSRDHPSPQREGRRKAQRAGRWKRTPLRSKAPLPPAGLPVGVGGRPVRVTTLAPALELKAR